MMDGFFGMGFDWILWLIIIVIVWMVFIFKSNNYGHYYKGNRTPLEILKKRYARGETSKEEFDRMKKDLM